MTENPPTKRSTVAQDVVRLASLWVAAGALYKLFQGSPNDMPPILVDKLGRVGRAHGDLLPPRDHRSSWRS